jgi:hypothetical protein
MSLNLEKRNLKLIVVLIIFKFFYILIYSQFIKTLIIKYIVIINWSIHHCLDSRTYTVRAGHRPEQGGLVSPTNFTLLFLYYCLHIIIFTLLFTHYYLYIIVFTLLFTHYYFHIIVYTLLFTHYYFHIIIFTLLFTHYYLYIIVYTLLFSHYCFYIIVFTLLFLHYC